MYIAPDTEIAILSGIPLDPTYNHTLYWVNEEEQDTYFNSKRKYTLTQQSYQRHAKGTMRVAVKTENLYDCNYLMFRNSAFGPKWFYAFITKVEYINNGTSEITYEIDVLQTWFWDYELKECFVEREHTNSDVAFQHTVPEGLEQGPYYVAASGVLGDDDPAGAVSRYLVLKNFGGPPDFAPIAGTVSNGIYCALSYEVFITAEDLDDFLIQVTDANKLDGIVAIYNVKGMQTGPGKWESTASVAKQQGSFQGYTPRNKKLYSYPYNLLHVYGAAGMADFRYELFSGSCTFKLTKAVMPEIFNALVPVGYDGKSGDDIELRLVYANYPTSPFNNDVFRSYLAANEGALKYNEISNAVRGVTGVVQTVGGIATGNVAMAATGIGNISGTIQNTAQLLAQQHDIKTKPPQTNGTNSPSSDFILGADMFRYKCLKITAEYAKIIDDYFTMYGYACHRVKVPNIFARDEWTYTKTVGCVLTGNIPSDDIVTICRIYDKGITFWTNPEHVGNYSLENVPVVG